MIGEENILIPMVGVNNLPCGSTALEQPRGAAGMEQPRWAAGLEQPRGAAGLEQPRGAAGLEQPRGAAGLEQPRGAAGLEQPRGVPMPAASRAGWNVPAAPRTYSSLKAIAVTFIATILRMGGRVNVPWSLEGR